MKRFICIFAIAAIANHLAFAYPSSQQAGYGAGIRTAHQSGLNSNAALLQSLGLSGADLGSLSGAASAHTNQAAIIGNVGRVAAGGSSNIPFSVDNTAGNAVTSSITYPQNKGEILIHRPAAIIVKRPPTSVIVHHPALIVKPAPVVLHKPPAVVLRKVYVKHHPRPVRVEPVYVNVVKPPAEKYFVNEKSPQNVNAPLGIPQRIAPGSNIVDGSSPSGIGGPIVAAPGSDNSWQWLPQSLPNHRGAAQQRSDAAAEGQRAYAADVQRAYAARSNAAPEYSNY